MRTNFLYNPVWAVAKLSAIAPLPAAGFARACGVFLPSASAALQKPMPPSAGGCRSHPYRRGTFRCLSAGLCLLQLVRICNAGAFFIPLQTSDLLLLTSFIPALSGYKPESVGKCK